MLRPVLVLIALVTLGVSPAGCSSEGEPPADFDAAAVRDGLAALFAGDHPEAQDSRAGDCFAGNLTSETTPEELRAAGLLDERYDVVGLPVLSPGLAEKWVDAQFACTDFVEESTRAQIKVTKGRLDPDAYAACLRELMPEADLRAAVVETLTAQWDGEHVSRLGAAQSDCAAQSRGTPAGG